MFPEHRLAQRHIRHFTMDVEGTTLMKAQSAHVDPWHRSQHWPASNSAKLRKGPMRFRCLAAFLSFVHIFRAELRLALDDLTLEALSRQVLLLAQLSLALF